MNLTDEEIRIKVAEACGWKPDDDGAGLNTWEASWVGNKLYGLRPTFRPDRTISSYTADCVVPDYLNDLNDTLTKLQSALKTKGIKLTWHISIAPLL